MMGRWIETKTKSSGTTKVSLVVGCTMGRRRYRAHGMEEAQAYT
jgi:hypothetical protein